MNGLGSAHEKWARDDCNTQIRQPWEKDLTTHKCFNIFDKYCSAKTHVIDPKYPDPLIH